MKVSGIGIDIGRLEDQLLQMTGLDANFLRVSNQVNDIGRKAVHQGLLSEDEARSCLQNARQALQLLLRN